MSADTDQDVEERLALLEALRAQRAHVLTALDGLSDDALRRPVLPSGWTCLGLVQHLALDVERFWLQAVVAGRPEGTGMPCRANSCFPWYSSRSIFPSGSARQRWLTDHGIKASPRAVPTASVWLALARAVRATLLPRVEPRPPSP